MPTVPNHGYLTLVPVLVLVAGCFGPTTTTSGPPSADEIQNLRANQRQEPPPLSPSMRAVAALPIREWGIRETAVDAIARIGEPAVPVLVQSLSDPDPGVRAQAARALARMGVAAKPAVPDLVKALHDSDEGVRIAAARALGQIGPAASEALPALVELLRTPGEKPKTTASVKQ
jgi:HEAT repeat protein